MSIIQSFLCIPNISPVAFDAKATSTTQISYPGLTGTNSTLTIGSGSNRALIVCASYMLKPTTSGVVWDAASANQAMTLIASKLNGSQYVEIWGLVNPVSGNKIITLTGTAPSGGYTGFGCLFSGASFKNVNQSGGTTSFANAVTASGNSNPTAPSITVTSSVNDMSIGAVSAGDGGSALSSPTQTTIFNTRYAGGLNGAASYAAGASSATHGWTLSANVVWSTAGCDIVAG